MGGGKSMQKTLFVNGIEFPVHELLDGRVIVLTSKHGFLMSDGSNSVETMKVAIETEQFSLDYLNVLTLDRSFVEIRTEPFRLTDGTPKLSPKSIPMMDALQSDVRIGLVLVPYMFVGAMKEAGIRGSYDKIAAYNSTPETARCSNPQDKVVDITNFAW
jgi:hypothetical protein